jgi:hypothetical protein
MNNLLSGLPVLYALITFAILMSVFSLCLAGFRRAERTQQPWRDNEKLGYYSMTYDQRIPYSPPQQQQEAP